MSTRAVAPVVAAPVAVLTPLQRPMLQRTCDCGEHTGGGECEECKKKKKMALQRHANGSAAPTIAPPIVRDVLRSPGQPLDDGTETYFAKVVPLRPIFSYRYSVSPSGKILRRTTRTWMSTSASTYIATRWKYPSEEVL